jgi:hypothetical protein
LGRRRRADPTARDYRWSVVSDGAVVGALRSFSNIPVTTSHPIEIPVHIESRVARVSYGYRCGIEPGNDITWFIRKVC